ncbi:3-oxoadipate enol-lactonase [Piscinibacter sakaiensis]|uniref:3-oxoadipate enol-lactonase n=1 Tax=Piscinibacter sakaiensis TaxID=1547922 RepID=UPI003AAD3B51
MQTALVNGAHIAFRIDGPRAAPTVMLSNSLMSSHRMWDPQIDALLQRFRVLRYDTRGHGASETTPGPYRIEQLADDAAALIEHTGVGPVHFVGLSMGGMIGQQLAVRHPRLVASLSLCDTASEMPPRSMWDERIAIAETEGIAGLVDGTIKRWFVAGFVAREPDTIANVRSMILGTSAAGYIACASAVRDMSQTHLLGRIEAPTQVIVGREDPACTLAASEVLQREISGAELHVIDDAAHLANIEKPAEFTTLLLDFIGRQ